MDRKSKQKIGYILWALAAAAILVVLFTGSMGFEKKIREKQMQELIVIYPEIENELRDNYAYYQNLTVRVDRAVMGTAIFLISIFGIGLMWIKKRENRKDNIVFDHEIDLIYEQLVRFQKGSFESILSSEDSGAADCAASDRLKGIHEKLRELGYYFSDLKERLTEEENSTKALITDISHQLKTPLASVRMCHELAQSSDLSEDERRDFLETETQEIRKMETLLGELVKLSRLENNMIRLKPENKSLKQTISEAVGQIFMKAHAKKIEICADMEKDAVISHDRKWTEEAFANVLENAVKYSEPMTTIHIRVVHLSANVLIEIED